MSNEELHIDGDFTLNIPHFEADFTENEQPKMQADFKIQTGGSTSFANITGSPYDNAALSDALNQKADTSTVETLSETVENNYTELDGKITDESDARTQADADLQSNIDDVADDLSIETDNRQTADADLQDNIDTVDGKIDTHIADKSNPHEVTKAQIGLGNVDNTSDLNKPISTATQTALNDKQNTINDLATIRTNASNGQSAYNTIQNYGDIVTYDASYFATSIQGQKADTALQPNDNITELNNNAGYITSASLPTVNNNKITIQKNSTDAGSFTLNQSSDKTINISVPTQASDINAVPTSRKINNKALSSDITLTASDVNALSSSTTINDLTTSAQQDALNSGATSTNIGQITTNANDIADIEDLIPTQATSSNQLADKSFVNSSIATNTANFIGTFNSVAELEAYSGTLTNNDYAFVETTDTAGNTLYDRYKWNGTQWLFEYELNNSSFTSNQWASINSGITSNDVTLIGTALQPNDNISSLTNDAGYITSSSLPTVNNGTLTIQQNGTDIQTFGANQSSNATANITVPTDTSDLTNDAGFITNSALSGLATQTDLTNGLATKQDTISDLSTIRSNATNGQSAYTTIGGYGDIVTYNASNFVQKNGDSSTQTISLTSGTGTTALGIKSMATSSYISFSGSSGWLGSFGVTSNKRPAFYNGTGYTLAYTSEIPTNTSELTNDSGFITGIGSNDVITALGYTPASNSAFTGADGTNAGSSGLVPAPSATDNDKYLKGDGTWASVSSGSSTDVQINGTSITSNNVANILTESAYSSSNKIATMSDLPSGGANTDLSNLTATGEAHFQSPLSQGTGISITNNTINHSNSVTAGIIGTEAATSGSTLYVPYATYDAQGHITAKGTHTHTVTGFLTSSSSQVASSRFDGAVVYKYSKHNLTTTVGTKTISLSSYLPSGSSSYLVLMTAYANHNNSTATVVDVSGDSSMTALTLLRAGANGRYQQNSVWLPVNSSKTITVTVSNGAISNTLLIELYAYRRIGTNT